MVDVLLRDVKSNRLWESDHCTTDRSSSSAPARSPTVFEKNVTISYPRESYGGMKFVKFPDLGGWVVDEVTGPSLSFALSSSIVVTKSLTAECKTISDECCSTLFCTGIALKSSRMNFSRASFWQYWDRRLTLLHWRAT